MTMRMNWIRMLIQRYTGWLLVMLMLMLCCCVVYIHSKHTTYIVVCVLFSNKMLCLLLLSTQIYVLLCCTCVGCDWFCGMERRKTSAEKRNRLERDGEKSALVCCSIDTFCMKNWRTFESSYLAATYVYNNMLCKLPHIFADTLTIIATITAMGKRKAKPYANKNKAHTQTYSNQINEYSPYNQSLFCCISYT